MDSSDELLKPGSRLAVKCLDEPRDVDAARDEVVVEVSAGERGVDVSDVVVHYTLGSARGVPGCFPASSSAEHR